jgi:hypothetical protein
MILLFKDLGRYERANLLSFDCVGDIAAALHREHAHWHFVIHAEAKRCCVNHL